MGEIRKPGKRPARRPRGGLLDGIGIGGGVVIVGLILMLAWSFWLGVIVVLIGLIALGGFAKGKWY